MPQISTDAQIPARDLHDALAMLIRELVLGAAESGAFLLNPGDRGLLASLNDLSADSASERPGGRSSVAAHVDHLRYGLELRNRWSRGENPWPEADWTASWERQRVAPDEWEARRRALERAAREWLELTAAPRAWSTVDLAEVIGTIAHLAYHLGAIRQVAQAASGPPATG
jgi:hypothetical protein